MDCNTWNLRRLAWLTLPALLVGLLLRVALMWHLPYGTLHPDSSDLLCTPDQLLQAHSFGVFSKKTFLVPVLYTLACAVPKVPALVVIPLAQHLMGLGAVVITALLCRLWFRHWQWLVPPVTLLLAADPALIWFEHALMTEAVFVFCTALLALAGTLYALRPEKRTFVFLCAALVLEAGARPEGKLLFAFGFLLIFLVAWPQWRKALRPLAILLLVAVPTHFATRTSQAGLLLYVSVLRLAPESSRVAPGVEAYTAELRDALVQDWKAHPSFPKASKRQMLFKALQDYQRDHRQRCDKRDTETLCKRLAFETCLRAMPQIPGLILHKWKDTAWVTPADDFLAIAPGSAREERAVANSQRYLWRNAHVFTGRPFESEEEVGRFFHAIDPTERAAWFTGFTKHWSHLFAWWRTPDTVYPDGTKERGLPVYMFAAFTGFALLAWQEPRRFHVAWWMAIVGLYLVILLTANVRPRFRLFLEPYWVLGCAALADAAVQGIRRWKHSAVGNHHEPAIPNLPR
ncbi:MAG: hypothetical protein PHQ12_13925 [Chthoniobacteraceae bacterium]|nr:hypothetical protein [Chthoniobacteraceae bacterium]